MMEAVRIGKTSVYMWPLPLSRRRLWLVQTTADHRAGKWWAWHIRSYRIAAHYI